jgi:PAS domain S-box-containing protein
MTRDADNPLRRLEQAESALEAIRNEQVDAVVGSKNIVLLKLYKTEQALMKSEERLRMAMDAAKLASWEKDLATGKVISCQRLREIFGFSATHGKSFRDEYLSLILEEDRNHLVEADENALATGEGFEIDYRIRRPDGEIRWLRSQVMPLKDVQGLSARLIGVVADITERKKIHEALQASLEEKEILLREVHHRVKNNLAIISALVDMENQYVEDPAAAALLRDLNTRIRSIVLVHERLYQTDNLALIDFQDYLDSLLQDLRYSLAPGRDILCTARTQGISLCIDLAIPCGMIINELVTNAIRHAFPDGKAYDGNNKPEIRVEVQKDEGHYSIVVSDNGVGFPEEIDLRTSPSFGLRLVRMIGTHQLGGKFELDRGKGTRIIFIFKDRHKKT